MVIDGIATYIVACCALSAIAVASARHEGDGLNTKVLGVCTLLGLVATIAEPAYGVIFACVAVCAATDLSSGYMYNAVVHAAFGTIAVNALTSGRLFEAALGAFTGFAISGLLWAVTRRRGIGFADVKLFAVVGAALGASACILAFLLSFVIGALAVLLLFLLGARVNRVVRFGPYIALGTLGAVTHPLGL